MRVLLILQIHCSKRLPVDWNKNTQVIFSYVFLLVYLLNYNKETFQENLIIENTIWRIYKCKYNQRNSQKLTFKTKFNLIISEPWVYLIIIIKFSLRLQFYNKIIYIHIINNDIKLYKNDYNITSGSVIYSVSLYLFFYKKIALYTSSKHNPLPLASIDIDLTVFGSYRIKKRIIDENTAVTIKNSTNMNS